MRPLILFFAVASLGACQQTQPRYSFLEKSQNLPSKKLTSPALITGFTPFKPVEPRDWRVQNRDVSPQVKP